MWQHWINFLAAVWMIVSGFIAFSAQAMQTNFIVTGVIVGILAIWGALENSQRMGELTR